MPLYKYECTGEEKHQLEIVHRMDDSDKPKDCHLCHAPIERKISLVASKFPGADLWRR